ncbi:flavin reductase family protein [Paenibacillus chartarius]|uniref:Flavin reductase family protein n=1 Tax=Paenibacillus chartarius TaxID=747481 RepID=A0ABV6DLH2_9BACL
MLSIDPGQQDDRANYRLLIGTVVPRPIALVTTLSEQGVLNAAPFSYFNIVAARPPMVSVSVQRKPGGALKDTARNALASGAFVVHIADESYVSALNMTAAPLPPEESEPALAGLTPVASEAVAVPGLAEAKVRLECVLERAIPLGGTGEAPACDLLIGRVVRFHVDASLYTAGPDGETRQAPPDIDVERLRPVARLAGDDYSRLGERFTVERPR